MFFVTVMWLTGFYCPERTGFDLRGCPEGTYGPDPGYWSVSQCRQCDGGHYCSSRNGTAVTGQCQEGYYCSHGNTSPQPLSRAAGDKYIYQISTAGSHIQEIWNCQPCYYVRKSFSINVPIWRLLTNGSFVFCVSSEEGGPCPSGHYCPQAAINPLPCPRGTFSDLTKLASQVTVNQYCTYMYLLQYSFFWC